MLLSYLNRNFKIILLFSILLIVFYRSPYIFLNGRFIAEEGQFFFRNSFLNGPFIGLTQIMWTSPYINFWANISSVVASFLPLDYVRKNNICCKTCKLHSKRIKEKNFISLCRYLSTRCVRAIKSFESTSWCRFF